MVTSFQYLTRENREIRGTVTLSEGRPELYSDGGVVFKGGYKAVRPVSHADTLPRSREQVDL